MPGRPKNPYAPPGVETRTRDQGPGAGRGGLRVAGGVVAILFGLWGLLGGGCSVVAAVATRSIASSLSEELQKNEVGENILRDQGRLWPGMIVSGALIAAAGALANVVGVLFFFNRGRLLALIAVGLTVAGEGLFMALVAFNIGGLVKVAGFAFVGACALWAVGRKAEERPALTP